MNALAVLVAALLASSAAASGHAASLEKVSYDVTYVASQPVELYVSGVKVAGSTKPNTAVKAKLTVPCNDIAVKLTAFKPDAKVAFAAVVYKDGVTYATRALIKVETSEDKDESGNFVSFTTIPVEDPTIPDVVPLYANASRMADPDFRNPDYDFRDGTWQFSRVVDTVLDAPVVDFVKLYNKGAHPLAWEDGPQPKGTHGLRVLLPFCYDVPTFTLM